MARKGLSRSVMRIHKRGSDESEENGASDALRIKELTIDVKYLVNVDYKRIKEVNIQIDHMGNRLAESQKIFIGEDGSAVVDFVASLEFSEITSALIDELLANPVIFTLNDHTVIPGKPETASKASKPSSSQKSSKSGTATGPKMNIIGIGNVDLMPFVIGEHFLKEKVTLELAKKAIAQEVVSWANLPQLVVDLSTGGFNLIPDALIKSNNAIGITVESVYNAPSTIPDGTFYEASFPVPKYSEKTENVIFKEGVKTSMKDCECRKRWQTLLAIEGRGGLTKHKITHDACDILNPLTDVKLEDVLNADIGRIHWNQWRNSVMVKSGSNFFESKIMRYRVWPIEVSLSIVAPAKGKDKKGKDAGSSLPLERYTAFLNLGSLLYPGITRVRVASQLYTYSLSDLIKKWGYEIVPIVPAAASTPVKGKPASASKAPPVIELDLETPGMPLYNEFGLPVFIIVEVELSKPFAPKRSPEFLHEKLSAYISIKGKMPKKAINLALAQERFTSNIKVLGGIIKEEFQSFVGELRKINPDTLEDNFYDYLRNSGSFQNMKIALQNTVIDLIGEKYGTEIDFKERVPDIYIYLVEEMHKIINTTVSEWGEFRRSFNVELSDLQLFAEEAFEEDEFEIARNYHLTKLTRDKKNPDYWLDYAIFCMALNEDDKAVELAREALSWDSCHQIGLLLYGLILAKMSDYYNAEIAFQTLLDKYPEFTEGWMILHLFYQKTENHEGAEVTLQMATKLDYRSHTTECPEDENPEESAQCCTRKEIPADEEEPSHVMSDGKYGIASYVKGESLTDPLSWTVKLCPPRSLNIKTAVLLMKLSALQFAEMALAQELVLEKRGRTIPYLYYLSVSHYLSGRYQDAISHLDTAVKEFGKDCSLWSLMGHCYHKLKNYKSSIDCFEYVLESYNRPDDIHLIYLRMGDYYIKTKKYECAKKIYTTACKYRSSPRTWVGIGIACYHMSKFDEAEEAFTEANNLDSNCPIIWGYLALVNIQLQRQDVFQECFREALKKNLKDRRLLEKIKFLSELNGFEDKV